MAELRPFPPSARRRALARAAGLTAVSPLLVGGVACAAAMLAIAVLGRALVAQLGAWLAAACGGEAAALAPGAAARAVLTLGLPALATIGLAALAAHVIQTRAPWLPRRHVPGAPRLPAARATRAGLELAAIALIGGVAVGWLWWAAPQLAALGTAAAGGGEAPAGAMALLRGFGVALAIAWIAVGVVDAVVRHGQLARALFMTATERREDERLSGADPRWRRARAERAGTRAPSTPRAAVATAAVLLLGDGLAVAIAWEPARQPVPRRTARGAGPTATQLLALARRLAVPVHHDPALAAALADADGPVPAAHWPRLAEIIAATRPR